MSIVGWGLALIIGVALALFAVQNVDPVSINFFGLQYPNIPTWVVVVGSAAVGALMMVLIGLVDRIRWFLARRQSKRLLAEHKKAIVQRDNRIHELEQELLRLRGAA